MGAGVRHPNAGGLESNDRNGHRHSRRCRSSFRFATRISRSGSSHPSAANLVGLGNRRIESTPRPNGVPNPAQHCAPAVLGCSDRRAAVEEHEIDVRDVDTEWFLNVRVWLDRITDRYYLPRESAARLGEMAEDGSYCLLDGAVTAVQEHIEVSGQHVAAWSLPVWALTTRPSSGTARPHL